MDRMETVFLCCFIASLSCYLVSPSCKSTLVVYLVPLIPFSPVYSQFYPCHLPLVFALTVSFPPLPLPLYLLQNARHTPSPPYVSLPGQRCQQLGHITANCATCGPLKDRKKGGWGSSVPMELELMCIWWKLFITFWILPQSTVFNFQ